MGGVLCKEMRPKDQVVTREASAHYAYLGLPSISVSWMMLLDKHSSFMLYSLTVVSTIRTKLSLNKFCDKNKSKKNKKKMNRSQFCYLLFSYLGGVHYACWAYSYLCQCSRTIHVSKPL